MKNPLLSVFTILTVISLTAHAPAEEKWTRDMYAKHDYESFARLPMVHRAIDPQNVDYALLDAAVFYATNRQRDKYGLKPLKYSAALEKAAFEHARDMAKHNFFSHRSPISGKETIGKRMAAAGVPSGYSGENIHFHGPVGKSYLEEANEVVSDWMNSPGHRRNILNGSYHYLGCGVYSGKVLGHNGVIAVQNFSDRDAPSSVNTVIDYK